MNIDWKTLVQLRERHRQLAQEAVTRERRVSEQHAQQLQSARDDLQRQIDAKSALWHAPMNGQGGALSIDSLRQASAWSRVLDTHISDAGKVASQAQGAHDHQSARLDEMRRQLRAAAGDLEKAERMQERERLAEARQRELRAEDSSEELAVQRWTARHAAPH